MGYHVYKDRWTPVKGEKLKAVVGVKNKEDKFAETIMKDDCLVGHLPIEKTERFAKIIFFVLRACGNHLPPGNCWESHQSRRWKGNEGAL